MELFRKHKIPYHQLLFIETDSPQSWGEEGEVMTENKVEIEGKVEDKVKMKMDNEGRG